MATRHPSAAALAKAQIRRSRTAAKAAAKARAAARDSTLAAGPARRVAGKEELQVKSASTSGTTETVRRATPAHIPTTRGCGSKGSKGGGKKGAPKAKPKAKPKAAPLPGTVPVGSAGVQAEGGLVGPSALCWCSGGRARPAQNGGGTPTSAPGLVKSAFL